LMPFSGIRLFCVSVLLPESTMAHDDQTRRQLGDLEGLLEISRAMAATADLDDLLLVITSHAAKMLDADRATLFLYDSENHVLRSRVAQGVKEIEFPATKGIAGAVVRSGKPLNIEDAYEDSRFNREIDVQTGYRTRSLLALPLLGYDNDLVGVLEVLNKRGGPFEPYDESIASALSAQAGVALQRARLAEHYREKLQMEQAIEIARQIQQDFLPKTNPKVPGFEIVGWNCACDQVGGDCYDFFHLRDRRLAVSLGDAVGHGIGPALISVEARAALRGLAWATDDLSVIVNRANRMLSRDLAGERFITMFFGILDPGRVRLEYCSAGQAPILFYDRTSSSVRRLSATGLPLGMMADVELPLAEPLTFGSGDVLTLLTDGFFEWERQDGEQYGADRVCRTIVENADAPAEKILASILGSIFAFADTPQSDDLTVVLIKKM